MTPTTCAEVIALAGSLPFAEGEKAVGKIGGTLVGDCFAKRWPNFGFGYLHSSDHYAALKVLLEREPTFLEVYDSYHGGSGNIDAAREKMQGGDRPDGWEDWTETQRLYAVLVKVHGITKGSRILDGAPDPKPEKTRERMLLWGMKLPGEPNNPPPAPPPIEPPAPAGFSGTLTISEGGVTRRFKVVEIA